MAAPWRSEWLEFAKSMGPPPALPPDPIEKAKAFNAFMVSAVPHLPPSDPGITTEDRQISDTCKVRIYTPPTADATSTLPLVLFLHGGGFFAGNLDTEDHTCRTICADTPAIVISVDFRTGWTLPVHDSITDSVAAFTYAYEHAAALRADRTQFVICGGSAGAAIGLATIAALVRAGQGTRVAGFVSMNGAHVHEAAVPAAYAGLMKSGVENGGAIPFVTRAMNLERYEVLQMQPPHTNVRLFPLAGGAAELTGFPPAFIITSENDSMRDDGTVLAAALRDAGVKAEVFMFDGLAHYFWHFPLREAGREFREKLVEGVRWTVAQRE